MRSTFMGLEVAKRSLFAQQTAIATTGHNIANANTAGYSRQTVNLVASIPMEAPGLMRSNTPGQLGTGVEFNSIERIREKFLDTQYYNENQSYGVWSVRKDALDKLETIFNEPSDTGIRTVVEDFWNAWQTLSQEPENVTARAALKEQAAALTDAFNDTSQKLADLSNDLSSSINVKMNDANLMLKQVADLNREIYRIEGLGDDANDLRDQRDLIMDNLSKIVNVKVVEQANGYTISMGNTELVNGINVTKELASDMLTSSDLTSGELKGYLVARDENLKNYQDQLNSMVRALAEGINTIHKTGYTLEDPPQTGISFFTIKPNADGSAADPSTVFTAENIRVNPDILNKVALIAASAKTYDDNGTTKVVRGNNEVALAIASFREERIDFPNDGSGSVQLTKGTFDEFYRAVIGQLGVQANEANRQTTNQQVLVEQVDSRRQAVSGVSLDEEMANMIKFQHAYNAAARALTTFDEMLDKVINSMGLVGR